MERLTNVDQQQIDQIRADRDAGAATRDLDLMKKVDAQGFDAGEGELGQGEMYIDRSDRPHVSYYQKPDGSWAPSNLKPDDHIMLFDVLPLVVIGTCSGRNTYACVSPEVWGDYSVQLMPLGAPTEGWYTDRAPADPNEPAMPIFPEEPSQGGEP